MNMFNIDTWIEFLVVSTNVMIIGGTQNYKKNISVLVVKKKKQHKMFHSKVNNDRKILGDNLCKL